MARNGGHVCNFTPEGRRRGRLKANMLTGARSAVRRARTRELAAAGWPVPRIARELGVHISTIYAYLRS